MSLIRDALNKAQQEQDAARTGRPAPRFTPSYSGPSAGNGPATKIFAALIALGAIMGCVALFLQIFYPMSRVSEKEPVPQIPENRPPVIVAEQIPPRKTAPKETTTPVAATPPAATPVAHPTPPPPPSPPPLILAPVVLPTPLPAPPVTSSPTIVSVPPVVTPAPAPPSPTPAPTATPPAVADGPSQDLIEFVGALAIRAVMAGPGVNRVSIQGRVFQSGDFLPGAPKPLRLDQITKDKLTFKDNAGHSYTKRL